MEKPKDFDTARATGEFKPLPAGGYVCEIIGVDETMSKTGKKMIKIALDIAEGDEKGRFMESYKSDTREFKKWPAGAVVYQLTEDPEGNTHGRFKQFTNCVTDSNKGFEIRWGKEFGACFKGKQVGVILEENNTKARKMEAFGGAQNLSSSRPWPRSGTGISKYQKTRHFRPEVQ